jgi:uncharacterized protein (TIGR01244 family)
MSTSEIYNYRKVNDDLITGGQPTEEQIKAAAQEGFTTVINLATINPRYSLPDVAGVAQSLGMTYHHIPVEWENPKPSDFDAFVQVMQKLPQGKTLLHCAANYRATAFYSLYALKHLGWSETQAEEFRDSIWHASHYPIWEEFIRQIKNQIIR